MRFPVFPSVPRPHRRRQQRFLEQLKRRLRKRGIEPRTLGVTDYDMSAPVKGIRRMLLESNGLIGVALRRTRIDQATSRHGADVKGAEPSALRPKTWLTSPWCHIEAAMVYQIGLPILICRERGVLADGVLDRGVLGLYMPEFDLRRGRGGGIGSKEFNAILGQWEGQVQRVVESKGNPPRLC